MTAETNRSHAAQRPRRTPPPRTASPIAPSSIAAVRRLHGILVDAMAPSDTGSGKVRTRKRSSDGRVVHFVDYTNADGNRKRVGAWITRAEAEQARRHLIRERDLEKLGMPTGRDIALGELSRRYVRDLRTRVGHSQADRQEIALRQVRAAMGDDRGAATISVADLTDYQHGRTGSGASNRTANIDAKAVHAAVRWGIRQGLLDSDPLDAFRALPEGRRHQVRKRRALDEDEIGRFMLAARELDADRAVPQAPLYHAMLVLGLRWGECATLEWGDVDLERRQVRVRADVTKTARTRALPLPEGLAADLRALRPVQRRLKKRGRIDPGWRVFLSPRGLDWRQAHPHVSNRHLRRILSKAGVATSTAAGVCDQHALRHTCATRLARQGVPPHQLQRILGHSTVQMTMEVYAHVADADLGGALSDLGGGA